MMLGINSGPRCADRTLSADHVRQSHYACQAKSAQWAAMDSENMILTLKRLHVPHERIAEAIGRDRTAATKMLAGKRSVKASEMAPLLELLREYEPEEKTERDYLAVDILPSFAGMGGGGNGDVSWIESRKIPCTINDLKK